jgi:hypothetical protein
VVLNPRNRALFSACRCDMLADGFESATMVRDGPETIGRKFVLSVHDNQRLIHGKLLSCCSQCGKPLEAQQNCD